KLIGSTVDPFPSRLEKQEREFRSRESNCFEERFSGLLEERRSPFQAHFRGDRPELGGRLAPITSASRNSRIRTRQAPELRPSPKLSTLGIWSCRLSSIMWSI